LYRVGGIIDANDVDDLREQDVDFIVDART
jgi:hypothetical protein